MLYLQENLRQQTLANIFSTSQPTISRAINNVLNVLDVVLPPPPQPKDLHPQRLYVLDGTLVPCWWWKNARNLYSGKHHRAGHNLQVLTDQAGEIFYISEPLPGSTHDITAIRNTGLFGYMQPWHCTADKGYVGLGCDTPFKRRPGKPLLGWQKRFNKGINQIRYVVERSIAHLKVWRILSTPCRLPRITTIRAINVIRKIMFYQPPTEPHFPSSWINFLEWWVYWASCRVPRETLWGWSVRGLAVWERCFFSVSCWWLVFHVEQLWLWFWGCCWELEMGLLMECFTWNVEVCLGWFVGISCCGFERWNRISLTVEWADLSCWRMVGVSRETWWVVGVYLVAVFHVEHG